MVRIVGKSGIAVEKIRLMGWIYTTLGLMKVPPPSLAV
jgi:hypothetical protein